MAVGIVSGFNIAHRVFDPGAQQVRGIDLAGMDLWMRNWCNKNPTKLIADGAMAFITEMLTDGRR